MTDPGAARPADPAPARPGLLSKTVHVVHGEPESSAALRGRNEREPGRRAVAPRSGEHVLTR